MVDGLGLDLRRHGIPRDYIHAEHFAFRLAIPGQTVSVG